MYDLAINRRSVAGAMDAMRRLGGYIRQSMAGGEGGGAGGAAAVDDGAGPSSAAATAGAALAARPPPRLQVPTPSGRGKRRLVVVDDDAGVEEVGVDATVAQMESLRLAGYGARVQAAAAEDPEVKAEEWDDDHSEWGSDFEIDLTMDTDEEEALEGWE